MDSHKKNNKNSTCFAVNKKDKRQIKMFNYSNTLSPSWMSAIFSPVQGLIVGNTLPLSELINLLLMKI